MQRSLKSNRSMVNIHQLKYQIDTKIVKIGFMVQQRLQQKQLKFNKNLTHNYAQTENIQNSASLLRWNKEGLKKTNELSCFTRENSARCFGLNKDSLTHIGNIIGSQISIDDQISNEQSFTLLSNQNQALNNIRRKDSEKQEMKNAIFQQVQSQADSLQENFSHKRNQQIIKQGFTFRKNQHSEQNIKNEIHIQSQKKNNLEHSLQQLPHEGITKQKSQKKLRVQFCNTSINKQRSCRDFRPLRQPNNEIDLSVTKKIDCGSSIHNKSRISSFYQDSEKQIQRELQSDRERDSFFISRPKENRLKIQVSQQTLQKMNKEVEGMIARVRREPNDQTVRKNLLKRIEQKRITYKNLS